jgi:dolichyl-phosphate-mannose--protein O-mannosyl transferase
MLIDVGVVGIQLGLCNGTMCSIKVLGFIGAVWNGVVVCGELTCLAGNGSMVWGCSYKHASLVLCA